MSSVRRPRKLQSGVVVQGGLGLAPPEEQRFTSFTPTRSHYRAIVIATRVTDSPDTFLKYQVECDIILIRTGARLLNVPVLQRNHGVNNAHELWQPKPTTHLIGDPTAELNLTQMVSRRGTYVSPISRLDDIDGDMVLVSFIEGQLQYPIIVGAMTHKRTNRKVVSGNGWSEGGGGSERGKPHQEEYYTRHSGTEIRVNRAGDVLVDSVGATTDDVNETPTASGGQIRIRVKSAEHFTVEMNGTDVFEVYKSGSQVRIDLGEGATERLILGDSFRTFLNNFLSAEYGTHTHSTGTGPSGPPTVPATSMPTTLLSNLAKTKQS